jgi:hypothetical protein
MIEFVTEFFDNYDDGAARVQILLAGSTINEPSASESAGDVPECVEESGLAKCRTFNAEVI